MYKSGKDILIDFLNLVFTLALIGFCLFYFTVGNRFANFTAFMRSLVPLAFFGIIFLIKLKLGRSDLSKRKREDNMTVTLYLTYFDKIKSNIIVFSLPIIICLLAFFINKKVGVIDVMQASIAFIIAYVWQESLFKKER